MLLFNLLGRRVSHGIFDSSEAHLVHGPGVWASGDAFEVWMTRLALPAGIVDFLWAGVPSG